MCDFSNKRECAYFIVEIYWCHDWGRERPHQTEFRPFSKS